VEKNMHYSDITDEVRRLAAKCEAQVIPKELFSEHNVYRGLRDLNGNGVLAGLTNIGNVTAKKMVDGVEVPMDGKLYYRGINIEDLVAGFLKENRFGFEETTYLLLFGELPTAEELAKFRTSLMENMSLPPKFTRDIIMKAPTTDIMNALSRSVLMLYHYDNYANDISIANILGQSLNLVSQFPLLAVYAYQAYRHYEKDQSLIIHNPCKELSYAENILHILRDDQQFTDLEAKILDLALVLHAEHGGGNNSTFTMRVVTSSGTDTYSAMAAALGSLKGPLHGGANIQVGPMMEDMKINVKNWNDDGQIADYLKKLLKGEVFDRKGLIYGIGHAIYSLSDPRATIFERFVKELSVSKQREDEYNLYARVARLAPEIIAKEKKMFKGVSPNIDFYSGFVYDMLNLPTEMFTPIFAIARVAGWSAHRIEELVNSSRIIRPAYKSVCPANKYIPLDERK